MYRMHPVAEGSVVTSEEVDTGRDTCWELRACPLSIHAVGFGPNNWAPPSPIVSPSKLGPGPSHGRYSEIFNINILVYKIECVYCVGRFTWIYIVSKVCKIQ